MRHLLKGFMFGLFVNRTAALVVVSAVALAVGVPELMAARPLGTDTSSTYLVSSGPTSYEVVIQLDGSRSLADVALDLAHAGYPTVSKFEGYSDRFRLVRVAVPGVTQATLDTIGAVPGVAAVRRSYEVNDGKPPVVHTGRLIMRLKAGATTDVSTLAARYGATVARAINGLPGAYVLSVPDKLDSDVVSVAGLLSAEPDVRYAQVSYLLTGRGRFLADPILDPLFPFQWHLNNTGQLSGGIAGADVGAVAAWDVTLGTGAIAAVIDTAVQRDHEDLKDNYITGYDFRDNDGDPSPDLPEDIEGHGTSCAGLIGARDNSMGVRGVAPRASLLGCRLGADFDIQVEDLVDAFLFCETNGAMVISNSYAPPFVTPTYPVSPGVVDGPLADAIKQIATTGRGGLGVLIMVSSGNSGQLVSFDNPMAAMPYTVAIGATNRDDTLTCYSCFGDEQSIVAPGGGYDGTPEANSPTSTCYVADIATTDIEDTLYPLGTDGLPTILGFNPAIVTLFTGQRVADSAVVDFNSTAYTHHFNGTSAACPVAAGVASLVFSVNPGLTAREARNLLEHTAKKVTLPNIHYDGVTGHNIYMGHGRVDALAAVLAAQAAKSWPSPVTDIQNISSQTLARIFWSNPDWDGDGTADSDVSGDLVVRGPVGQLDWAPVDGIVYDVGQQVAPGVIVVANDLITSLDQTGLPMGDYEYGIFVRNAANYYSWGRRTSFSSSGSTNVPKASIQTSLTSGAAPLAVHFAGGGIDATGLTSMTWTFGDGRTGTGAAIDHTYTSAGRYTATLKVTNRSGQTAQTTVIINVLSGTNAIPVANIQATPSSGDVPLSVIFNATATDSDGRVVRYDWNFGDGSVATGQTVEHIYLDAGTYGVTLTAVDNAGGEGMASVLITVSGTSTTAAQTVGTTTTTGLGTCGAGASAALMATSVGLLGLMALRRRR